jgi:hypothetical protein
MRAEPMHRRAVILAITASLLLSATTAVAVQAGGPEIERQAYTDRFHDEFIADLCGIDTFTTVTERWSSKVYPDGSEVFHVVRTFVPDDPRIPIEKGAATTFFAPDGSRRVVGKPIQLFKPDGGVLILDAGWVQFDAAGDVVTVRGPHPSLDVGDLAPYYCP